MFHIPVPNTNKKKKNGILNWPTRDRETVQFTGTANSQYDDAFF